MSTAVVPINERFKEQAITWTEQAEALQIIDAETHTLGAAMLLGIKDLEKEVAAHHRPIKAAAHATWKETIAAEKRLLEPLLVAEAIIKPKLARFQAEEQRKSEEARRKAEQERARLEAEARQKAEEERQRLEAEAQRKAEEELEAAIEQAEAEGASPQEIEALIEEPVVMPAVELPVAEPVFVPEPPPPPKVSGVSMAKKYRAEVLDLRKLAHAVATGEAPENLVQPNMTALNGMARALKAAMNVPGVRVVVDDVIRAGRR